MVPSYFSPHTYSIQLSSLPPTSSMTYSLTAVMQGITKAIINYTGLSFIQQPYKVVLEWDLSQSAAITTINDVYLYDSVIDPLSTFTPTNSGLSTYVFVPQTMSPQTINSRFRIFYENGYITTFLMTTLLISENIIDMDLNLIDAQNTRKQLGNVYNIQSVAQNIVFNVIDS